jgi:demethoxyubiquinone hydroxylase (CLK1/Coq7/Cat5 family)
LEPENFAFLCLPDSVHRLVIDHYEEAMSYLEEQRQEARVRMAEHRDNRIRALEEAAAYERMAAAYERVAAAYRAAEENLRASLQAEMNTDE